MREDNGEEVEVGEQEQYAVVDKMNMDNFDELLPVSNRAIVYPFEMDVF